MTRPVRSFLATVAVSVGVLASGITPADPGTLPGQGITDTSCTRADYDRGLVVIEGRNYLCRYLPDPRTFVWRPDVPRELQVTTSPSLAARGIWR